MDERLAQEKRLKDSAKVNRNFEDFKEALADLDAAIKILEKAYSSPVDSNYHATLRRELADCYGMKGGIYRRLAKKEGSRAYLEESAEMYKKGKDYEIDDSYNLTNSLVIDILLDPRNLEKQRKEIGDEHIPKIQEQVRGRRRDQWWAWADLGLFNILVGNYRSASDAYKHFTQLGARAQDYESTLLVLKELRHTLQEAEPSTARSVAASIGDIIGFLEGEKIELKKAELI